MKSHFLNKLVNKENLNLHEAKQLMGEILNGQLTNVQIAAILTALRMKGESSDEIVGFIQVIREHMGKVAVEGLVIDTCGTGGDGRGTFNISTVVAFVVAAAGVKVAKHGNRAVSSACGSADVLEALGVNINLNAEQAKEVLEKVGMVFLFAPLFHPAFKQVVPVRKELGIRTVFNFLGPFLNPARVRRQIMGAPNKKIAEKFAEVATHLGYEHLMIVSGRDGLDEISIGSQTDIFEIQGKTIKKKVISPDDFGIKKIHSSETKGGDSQKSAQIIRTVLQGEKGPYRDIVLINAAYAMIVAGKVKSPNEGMDLATKAIDSGKARKVLDNLILQSRRVAV